jgi:hypothetical protein
MLSHRNILNNGFFVTDLIKMTVTGKVRKVEMRAEMNRLLDSPLSPLVPGHAPVPVLPQL